jgi:hypothetical protein
VTRKQMEDAQGLGWQVEREGLDQAMLKVVLGCLGLIHVSRSCVPGSGTLLPLFGRKVMPACSIGRTLSPAASSIHLLSVSEISFQDSRTFVIQLVLFSEECKAFEFIGRLLAVAGTLEPVLFRFQDVDQI